MRAALRRPACLLVLTLWVLAGPLGMVFSGCALMCEIPCGPGTPSARISADASAMPLVARIVASVLSDPRTPSPTVLDPPPKSIPA